MTSPKSLILIGILALCCAVFGCTQKITKAPNPSLLAAQQLLKKGQSLKEAANDLVAHQTCLKADSLFAEAYPNASEEKGDCKYLLGLTAYNLGLANYSAAISYMRQADSIYLRINNIGKAADANVWLANAVWYRNGVKAALPHLDRAIELAEQDEQNTRYYRGKYYADKGYAMVYQYQFDKAATFLKKAYELDKTHFGPDHINTLNTLLIQADNYSYQEDYFASAKILKRVLAGFQKIFPADDRHLGVIYGSLGNVNFQLGNFIAAKDYFEKTLRIFSDKIPPNHPNNTTLYIKLIELNNNLEQFEEAEKWSDLASKYIEEEHHQYPNLKIGKGLIQEAKGEYVQAIQHLEEIRPLIKKVHGDSTVAMANLLESLASSYTQAQRYEQAATSIKKALNYYQLTHGAVHPSCARTLLRKSELLLAMNQPRAALAAADDGIVANGSHRALTAFEGNPSTWLGLLKNKAISLKEIGYQAGRSHWEDALSTIDQLDQYLNHLRSSYNSPREIQLLNKSIQEVYKEAVDICYLLSLQQPEEYAQLAYQYAEKSKNYRLLESLQRIHIPALNTFQLKQDKYQALSSYYHQKLTHLTDSNRIEKYQNYIVGFKDSIKDLRQQLRDQQPALFSALVQIPYNTPTQVQEKLGADEAMINYVITKKGVYAMVLNKEVHQLFLLEENHQVRDKIRRFRSLLHEDFLASKKRDTGFGENAAQYTQSAFDLYTLLVAPLVPLLKKYLIIVPDDELSYLPFEALLVAMPTKSHRFYNHPYWLEQQGISYNFSATIWHQQNEQAAPTFEDLSIAAFAPFCKPSEDAWASIADNVLKGGDQKVQPLYQSKREVEKIVELFSGEVFLNEAASIDQFEKVGKQYPILHLSTHGSANNLPKNEAYILLASRDTMEQAAKIYLSDIASYRIPAKLVVVSACESGVGPLDQGEGIISLTRAFTQAGTKSLLNSLWKVDDQATADLMIRFYEYLKQGQRKDEALQNAKSDFIKSAKDPEKSHPYYWASFILTGQTHSLY